MRVPPVSVGGSELTPPERELADATKNFSKLNDPNALPAINQILSKYPDFADGYLFRLGFLCDGSDRQTALSDVNNAIKFEANSRAKDMLALLSMRAKLIFAGGDYAQAMTILDDAIRRDPKRASEFTSSGAAKPEKTGSICVWTSSDMDAITQRFPADYRSYMFRGLYFSKFAPIDDDSFKPAMESFEKAIQLNPKSPLPQLFKTELLGGFLTYYKRLAKLGWNDDSRNKLDAELVQEYSKALALDANLLPALKGRALAYFHLKQYRQAISDYDHILSIDGHDATSVHDRGLAKMSLGQPYDAISDYSSFIDLKKMPGSPLEGQNDLAHGYESRGDAYVKSEQWNRAVSDYTKTISIQIGTSLLLMNVGQFRELYPEYRTVPDDILARKLQQTFYPKFEYDDFSKGFFERRPMSSTVIPDLYVKRADAYLGGGNWRQASVDFRRAANGFPSYADALDRWREIAPSGRRRTYLDLKSFDDSKRQSVKVWIKQLQGSGEPGAEDYVLQQFELNCGGGQLRLVSFANYDASGELMRNGQGGRWGSPIPETVGETVYNGACRSN